MRLPEVARQVGFGKSQIYALMRAGEFPQSVKLSRRVTAWRSDEIAAYIEQRTAQAREVKS
ncbi:AlpA family phage regulatory protein [Algiphilus sp.]|uniref:helix-turn-helix transcriptional regulator n=1 Tax=Algiphilus sp. TaxID=1872431 RepID=UPI0032EEB0D3